jgi:hypothetical protein
MRLLPAGLKLFSRTNSRKTFNLASWHSPHSLTWSWIISFRRHQIMWPKPFAQRSGASLGAGLGTLISAWGYRANGHATWDVCLLWCGIHYTSQQPMWFKDMIHRSWDEEEELKHENWKLRQQLAHVVSAPPPSNHVH